jgi:hypothetical protein
MNRILALSEEEMLDEGLMSWLKALALGGVMALTVGGVAGYQDYQKNMEIAQRKTAAAPVKGVTISPELKDQILKQFDSDLSEIAQAIVFRYRGHLRSGQIDLEQREQFYYQNLEDWGVRKIKGFLKEKHPNLSQRQIDASVQFLLARVQEHLKYWLDHYEAEDKEEEQAYAAQRKADEEAAKRARKPLLNFPLN